MFLNCGFGEDSWESHGLQPARLLCGSLGVLRITERAAREFWEISPGISLKGMRLKLKLQYFGHLMRRVDWLEKILMLGWIGGRRRRGWQRMRWLDGITNSMDIKSEWTPGVGDGQGGWPAAIHEVTKWRTRLIDWTELNWRPFSFHSFNTYSFILWKCFNNCFGVLPMKSNIWFYSDAVFTGNNFFLLNQFSSTFPASGCFPISWFFASGDQSVGVSASASVFPMHIQDWFPLGWTGLFSLQSKQLLRVFSNTIVHVSLLV